MSKQNTLWLHGFLYHTYQHSLNDAPLFKSTFLPKKWSWWTAGAWTIVLSMFFFWAIWVTLSFQLEHRDTTWPALICMFHVPLFLPVGERALIWGISVQFENEPALNNLPEQPSNMQRPIMRQVFFGKALFNNKRELPSPKELENCIEFIENDRVNAPKKWLELQHVIAILSIVVATINSQLGSRLKEVDWHAVGEIGFAVLGLLLLVGVVFGVMRNNSRDRWDFERTLRWYLITRQESLNDRERVKVSLKKALETEDA